MVFNFVSDERFRRPVTTTELEEFRKQEYEENEGEGEISETN